MSDSNLRPVFYRRLLVSPGSVSDESEEERKRLEDALSFKKGWFHGWTQVAEKDSHSDNYLVSLYGIIEKEDGKLETFPHEYFYFLNTLE